jgi:hypothetical protein
MNKYNVFFISILLFQINCSQVKEYKRDLQKLNINSFIGVFHNKPVADSQAVLMEFFVNRGFRLAPIDSSKNEKEVRIYFIEPFGEKFFRQQYNAGKLITDLYNCGMDNSNDSFFLKIGTRIRSKMSDTKKNLPSTELIPYFKLHIDDDSLKDALDAYSVYFIQIKDIGSKTKTIYINSPFEKEARDSEAKSICDFLRSTNSKFNFKFWDSWDITVVNALSFPH